MKLLKRAVGITFTLILVLGSQFFECAQVTNRTAQTQRPTVSTTIKPTTTIPPPAPPQTNCLENPDNSDPHKAIGKHPVSRLFEIQAKNHEPVPIFKDIGQRGQPNQNNVEFHVQVTINNRTASAWARTKKEAKRRAAIEMLTQMGLQIEADNSNTINPC
ncbi:uncharacterized protein LOC129565207 [Sitodiplosis mosellana]|uniref:uncharacterized protein LOC129565207 n=1 Tax=Sitodiplosis mosellana TaxID=263140 RepID=UPI0024446023|nr:uncharacterized protein LOC129565207 [Sitodiplosis mosellana]